MNKEQLQQKIDEAKANIEIWTKGIEKLERRRWQPRIKDDYFYIGYHGLVSSWKWDNHECDIECFKLGNVFKTEVEAEKERDRRLAEVELLDMCDGVQDKPYKLKQRWFLCVEIDICEFYITSFSGKLINPYIFATRESAQKAIDTLGAEKLKLIFRVD